MQDRFDRLIRWSAGGAIALALGASAGLGLGYYATGDGPVGLAERNPASSFSADPITPDADPELAQMAVQQQIQEPDTITCVGCGPGIAERRMMAQQAAYDRYIALVDPPEPIELASFDEAAAPTPTPPDIAAEHSADLIQ